MCEEEIQVRDSAEYPPVKVCEKIRGMQWRC